MSRLCVSSGLKRARWRQVRELFHRAADLDAERRRSLLDAECAGDVGLRREVESLLAADVEAEKVLTSIVASTVAELLAELGGDGTVPRPGSLTRSAKPI